MFQVCDTEAEERYRYIVASLTRDPHVTKVEESQDGANREVTVQFLVNQVLPYNPSLQHLHQVYGTTQPSARIPLVEKLLSTSLLDA